MNRVACLVVAVAVLPSFPAAAQEPRQIAGTLDFSARSDENTKAADRLFEGLEDAASAGVPVKLSLTLLPKPAAGDGDIAEFGYRLTAPPENGEAASVACGQDLVGVIDTYRTDYQLSFHHPDDFHHPTTIQLGERREFPFNALTCTFERGQDAPPTLFLQGTFAVTAADIPTATSLHLFPYNP